MYLSLHLLHFNQQPVAVNPVFVFFVLFFASETKQKLISNVVRRPVWEKGASCWMESALSSPPPHNHQISKNWPLYTSLFNTCSVYIQWSCCLTHMFTGQRSRGSSSSSSPPSLPPSEVCHNVHLQARSGPRALSLVWCLAHFNVVKSGVEAGAQQISGVAGRQRDQRAGAIYRQRG